MYWCFLTSLPQTPLPHTLAQTIYFFPVSLKTRPPKYNHRAATIATGGRAYCSIKKRKSHAGYIAKNKNIINQCPGQGGRSSWKLVSSLLPCLWLRLSQIRAPWGPPAIATPEKGDPAPKMGMLGPTPQCKNRLRARTQSAERTFANFLSCHVDFLFTIIAELSSPSQSPFSPCWPSWFTLQANGISIKFYFLWVQQPSSWAPPSGPAQINEI